MPPGLRGTGEITGRFLDECLDFQRLPAEGRGSAELPLVVLLGPRGTGKSAVLRRIEQRCRELVVPVARLDLDNRSAEVSPGQVASALAAVLAYRLEGVPHPRFPRLLLGQLVLDAPLPPNPTLARAHIKDLLRGPGRHLPDGGGIDNAVDLLEQAGVLPAPAALAVKMAVQGVGSRLLVRGGPMHSVRDWYSRDGVDPYHALATLHQYWRSEEVNERRSVHEAQLGAFLADLRAYRARYRSRVCVVLLDNADSPTGAGFLDTLIRVREAWDLTGPGERDSLLVVAAARRRPPTWSSLAPDEGMVRPREPEEASYQDWVRIRSGLGSDASWWYPVLLRGLGLGDTDSIASAEARRARAETPQLAASLSDLTAAVHRATGGHPWAVRALIGTVLRRNESTSRVDALRRALDTRVRQPAGPDEDPLSLAPGDATGPTLGEWALTRMLGSMLTGPDDTDALASLAAAWSSDDSAQLDQWISVPGGEFPRLYQVLKDNLWLVERPVPDPRVRPSRGTVALAPVPGMRSFVHPWLYTLLLHRLARGDEASRRSWDQVHRDLRAEYRREAAAGGAGARAAVRERYHALSAHALGDVVAYLGERWEDRATSPSAWLEQFNAITRAPNRLSRHAEPHQVLARLTEPAHGAGELDRLLWRLVGARWILCDPLADPTGVLRPFVQDLLRALGRASPQFQLFYDEADKYR